MKSEVLKLMLSLRTEQDKLRELLNRLPAERIESLLRKSTLEQARAELANSPGEQVSVIFEQLPEQKRKALLDMLPDEGVGDLHPCLVRELEKVKRTHEALQSLTDDTDEDA